MGWTGLGKSTQAYEEFVAWANEKMLIIAEHARSCPGKVKTIEDEQWYYHFSELEMAYSQGLQKYMLSPHTKVARAAFRECKKVLGKKAGEKYKIDLYSPIRERMNAIRKAQGLTVI
jgi:hypothetical protein